MSDKNKVDEFFNKLTHPLKAEMQAIRTIIISTSSKIEEDIKWGGPSFDFKEPMVTINPRITNYVALIFHKGELLNDQSGLLEPASKGKAYAKFHSMKEVNDNKQKLQKVVKEWINIMNK